MTDGKMEVSYCGAGSRRLYVVWQQSTKPRGTTLVVCPPLDQEMVNTYARLARWGKQLAQGGISVLRYHPLGMGESDGTHGDVTLESMVKDAVTAHDFVRQQTRDRYIGYFGLRLGATVSILAAAAHPADFLALWCPVTSLWHYFRELLRSQVTADAVHRSRRRSTQKMIADLEAGRNVDVWGYELSPGLYRQMAAMQALPDAPPARNVLWLVRPADETAAAPVVKRWQDQGSHVDFRVIPETAFWEYPGNTIPERFAAATTEWLSQIGEERTNGNKSRFLSERPVAS